MHIFSADRHTFVFAFQEVRVSYFFDKESVMKEIPRSLKKHEEYLRSTDKPAVEITFLFIRSREFSHMMYAVVKKAEVV